VYPVCIGRTVNAHLIFVDASSVIMFAVVVQRI
jgi:hypothetical protein